MAKLSVQPRLSVMLNTKTSESPHSRLFFPPQRGEQTRVCHIPWRPSVQPSRPTIKAKLVAIGIVVCQDIIPKGETRRGEIRIRTARHSLDEANRLLMDNISTGEVPFFPLV